MNPSSKTLKPLSRCIKNSTFINAGGSTSSRVLSISVSGNYLPTNNNITTTTTTTSSSQSLRCFHSFGSIMYGRRQRKPSSLKTPQPNVFAPSPFSKYPHRDETVGSSQHGAQLVSSAAAEREEAFQQVPLSHEQRLAVFPSHRKIALKIDSVATKPTNTLEFYVDERMTKPEIKQWLESVYGFQGIEKIHTSTHRRKKRMYRLNPRRKLNLPIRKKVYVELDHEVNLVDPAEADDMPSFDQDIVEDIASRAPGISSFGLNWNNRRWLKEVNPPSKGLHVHRSRHKLVREEMNKRLIVQKTLREIEELQRRVDHIEQEGARLGPGSSSGSAASGASDDLTDVPRIKDSAFEKESEEHTAEVKEIPEKK